jgi:hypothetical protein
MVDDQHVSEYNKSKLVIKDQWSSHPATSDRVERILLLNVVKEDNNPKSAKELFSDIENTQMKLTAILFSAVNYSGTTLLLENESFSSEYRTNESKNAFPEVYGQYYELRNTGRIDLSADVLEVEVTNIEELFAQPIIESVRTAVALQIDIENLKQIRDKQIVVKTFDYDGIKYKATDSAGLLMKVEEELIASNKKLEAHDLRIYQFFLSKEKESGRPERLKSLYNLMFSSQDSAEKDFALLGKIWEYLSFTQHRHANDVIVDKFVEFIPIEADFKGRLKSMFEDAELIKEMPQGDIGRMKEYLNADIWYFKLGRYNEEGLALLSDMVRWCNHLVNQKYYFDKRRMLEYQASL